MTRRTELPLKRLLALVLLATAISATVVGDAGAQLQPLQDFTVVARARDEVVKSLRVGSGESKRPHLGDRVVIGQVLRGLDGRRAGSVHFVETLVNLRPYIFESVGTFRLPDGDIAVQGLDRVGRADGLVITGGSGRYVGAEGTVSYEKLRRPREIRYQLDFVE
jgi:hypothetical protein